MAEIATLGAGCFWCVEAVFSSLTGVTDVNVGYCNGRIDNPTYEMVCAGETGHAEVAQISFNPDIVNYEAVLDLFFKTHDPTTLNKQGADIGTQYRSAIFYHSETQKEIALKMIGKLNNLEYYDNSIVTEVEKINKFYIAEDYHQNYYKNNKTAPYCTIVIKPKLDKINN